MFFITAPFKAEGFKVKKNKKLNSKSKSKKSNNNMEGTRPLTGPALPNLINAVRMLKSKTALILTLTLILKY
jgi:hypothetical protein